jgi:TPR repeat protein
MGVYCNQMEILIPAIGVIAFLFLAIDDSITQSKITKEIRQDEKRRLRSEANAAFPIKLFITAVVTIAAYYFYFEYSVEEQNRLRRESEVATKIKQEAKLRVSREDATRRMLDEKRHFDEVDARARKGFPDAEFQLGNLYRDGIGVTRDMVQAIGCWGAAALHGHVRAQTTLGDYYAAGRGVEKDLVMAAKMYRMASQQGDLVGLQKMAECYLNGSGVIKDEVEAFALLTLIAIRKGEQRTNFLKRVLGQGSPLEALESRLTGEQRAAGLERAKELQREIETY